MDILAYALAKKNGGGGVLVASVFVDGGSVTLDKTWAEISAAPLTVCKFGNELQFAVKVGGSDGAYYVVFKACGSSTQTRFNTESQSGVLYLQTDG